MAKQTVDSYVDDVNMSVNQEGTDEYNRVNGTDMNLEQASSKSLQSYAKYLFLTGGNLALKKNASSTG